MKNARQRKTWQLYGNYRRNVYRYISLLYMELLSLVCTHFYLFVVYTVEFSFRELPWSQRQAIFSESSQIGEYLFHLSYKNRCILTILKDKHI